MSRCLRLLLPLLLAAPATRAAAQATPPDLLREELRFANADVTLAATLLRPPGSERLPGVVLVHGSGTSDRGNPWTTAWAEALAAQGLVVLHPDKRGSGESGGDWLTASFATLAEDAAAGVRLLRDRSDVDPARVGVIGFSQGGYVVPLVARREPACRLVAVISGGVRTLLDQAVDELVLEAQSESAPLGADDEAAVRATYRELLLTAQGRQDWEPVRRAAEAARARGPAVVHALRTLPEDASHPGLGWMALVGAADPLPEWAAVTQPALFVFGGRDTQVRVQENIQLLWTLPPGRRDILLFGDNGHALFRADGVALLARWFSDAGAN